MRLEEATILVVDDETELREIFSRWLGRKGCRVLTASNGVEALEILEREKIDVLLSDIRMPIMGGVELVREVFKRKMVIPSIIFVSGFGDVRPREMYGLGVEALMEKPLSRLDLIRVLEDSLMEREELWLTPRAEPVEQTIKITLESLEEAAATCQFQMGRGGCCFATSAPLVEGKTIGLSIHFAADGWNLEVQGTVRWFDGGASQAGVSFLYLDPSCREWVLGAMLAGSSRSFVPQCRSCGSEALSAMDEGSSVSEPNLVPQAVT